MAERRVIRRVIRPDYYHNISKINESDEEALDFRTNKSFVKEKKKMHSNK